MHVSVYVCSCSLSVRKCIIGKWQPMDWLLWLGRRSRAGGCCTVSSNNVRYSNTKLFDENEISMHFCPDCLSGLILSILLIGASFCIVLKACHVEPNQTNQRGHYETVEAKMGGQYSSSLFCSVPCGLVAHWGWNLIEAEKFILSHRSRSHGSWDTFSAEHTIVVVVVCGYIYRAGEQSLSGCVRANCCCALQLAVARWPRRIVVEMDDSEEAPAAGCVMEWVAELLLTSSDVESQLLIARST